MNCYQPWWNDKQKIFCPCGHCFACRQAKAFEWTTRLILERASHNKVGFVTLTYENLTRKDELSSIYSLKPDDLKNFWKRLRKRSGRKFKYFACGEYGGMFGRPHYHAIVFGLSPSFEDRALVDKCWNLGRTQIAPVTLGRIKYVCGYVIKKYSKEVNKREYFEKGLEVPFQRSSRGLGLDYALAHGDDLSRELSIRLCTGREVPLPRYFVKKLGIDNERLKEKANDSMVKYVTSLFKQAKINRPASVESLGFMLFNSRNFAASDRIMSIWQVQNEQKRYNWERRIELFSKK